MTTVPASGGLDDAADIAARGDPAARARLTALVGKDYGDDPNAWPKEPEQKK